MEGEGHVVGLILQVLEVIEESLIELLAGTDGLLGLLIGRGGRGGRGGRSGIYRDCDRDGLVEDCAALTCCETLIGNCGCVNLVPPATSSCGRRLDFRDGAGHDCDLTN